MQSFTFLIHNIYHIGGTTRSITHLANELSEKGHDVTILTVFKNGTQMAYPLHPSITIDYIIDYSNKKHLTPLIANRIRKYTPLLKPKLIQPDEPGINQFSSYIEKALIKKIKTVSTDYLVGTRATYNLLIATYATTKTIGMEHMHYHAHPPRLQQRIKQLYPKLDYLTTLTELDKRTYETIFNEQLKIICVPNIAKAELQSNMQKENTILALGRLEYEKGFDLLIDAINKIKMYLRKMNYKVNIYGDGSERNTLEKLIQQHHLNDLMTIHPSTTDVESLLQKSKITVIPSRSEGFGMVILEAFLFNNAVVSFNAPLGPQTLLKHHENALVSECFNTTQFGDHIIQCIQDASLRNKLIEGGKVTLQSYTSNHIYQQFINALT